MSRRAHNKGTKCNAISCDKTNMFRISGCQNETQNNNNYETMLNIKTFQQQSPASMWILNASHGNSQTIAARCCVRSDTYF